MLIADACRYKCVIVLCDSQWCDPDLDSSNGIQMGLRDMLRIDSMLMMVQLNIRVLLEVCVNVLLCVTCAHEGPAQHLSIARGQFHCVVLHGSCS